MARPGDYVSFAARTLLLTATLAAAGPVAALGQSAQDPTLALSPELRAAFVAEMQHLDAGLQRVVSALARADWEAAERAAREIRGSFILEQRLEPARLEELHRVLPEPFLALDREFHARALRLAEAARSRDAELAVFYAYKTSEACVSCHAAYARHRFPGFAPAPEGHHH